MKQRLVLEGRTTAEKLAHVERILDSFRGRLGKTIVGIIPPVPIMHYCAFPENGLIARLLIPISGVIDKAYMRIGHYASREATITVTITSTSSSKSVNFLCNRHVNQYATRERIQAGDVIEIRGEGVSDIHIAVAIQPDMKQAVKESYMLEGFMALLEEDNGSTI